MKFRKSRRDIGFGFEAGSDAACGVGVAGWLFDDAPRNETGTVRSV